MNLLKNAVSKGATTILIAWQIEDSLVRADFCPASTSSLSQEKPADLLKPSKYCPDFKDDPGQNACCPSQIDQGSFYCCSLEQKEKIEAHLASQVYRRFIANHVSEIILCSIALAAVLLVAGILSYKRMRLCRTRKTSLDSTIDNDSIFRSSDFSLIRTGLINNHNQHRQFLGRGPQQFPRRYPYVSSAIPSSNTFAQKPLNSCEAPPPYEYSNRHCRTVENNMHLGAINNNSTTIPAQRPPVNPVNRNDWDCLVENALNRELDRVNNSS